MVVREMMLRRERMGVAGGRGDGWRSRRGGRDNASGRTGRREAVTYPLKLLHDLMVRRVLESHVVATDDTPLPMLSPGQRQDRDGEDVVGGGAAAYVGDERNPYDVFDYTTRRSRDGPAKFLKDYKGTLLAGGYGGYDGVVGGNQMIRAGSWAHTLGGRLRMPSRPTGP